MDDLQITLYITLNENINEKLGTLYTYYNKQKEQYSFKIDEEFLNNHPSFFLDPDIYNISPRQFPPINKSIFGFLLDSSPNRWGRTLIKRKEELVSYKNKTPLKALSELDYILNIVDETRMGSIRFSSNNNKEVFNSFTIPLVKELKNIVKYIENYEKAKGDITKINERELDYLLFSSSSLGGARPKVNVKDEKGVMYIAKLPSIYDKWDVCAWEYVANRLASLCGLHTASTSFMKINGKGVLFSRRFDRNNKGERIHYSSSMTVLGQVDNISSHKNVSYLDIASFIKEHCSNNVNENLKELFMRILFNILIKNTDDHLRNHGFLYINGSYTLSPLFDVNPTIDKNHLSLFINDNKDNNLNHLILIDVAPFFNISQKEANQYYEKMKEIINDNWRKISGEIGIKEKEIRLMEKAFIAS